MVKVRGRSLVHGKGGGVGSSPATEIQVSLTPVLCHCLKQANRGNALTACSTG